METFLGLQVSVSESWLVGNRIRWIKIHQDISHAVAKQSKESFPYKKLNFQKNLGRGYRVRGFANYETFPIYSYVF